MSKKPKVDKAKIINKINNKYELVAYLFTYKPWVTVLVIALLVGGFVSWLIFSGTTPEDVKGKVDEKIGMVENVETGGGDVE